MADSKYKQALEALLYNYQRKVNVSFQGRVMYGLHLLYDFAITIEMFEKLKNSMLQDTSDWLCDADVNYQEWCMQPTWGNIPTEQERVLTIWPADAVGETLMSNVIDNVFMATLPKDDEARLRYQRMRESLTEEIKKFDNLQKVYDVVDTALTEMVDSLRKRLNEFIILSNSINDNLFEEFANNKKNDCNLRNRISITFVSEETSNLQNRDDEEPWTELQLKSEMVRLVSKLSESVFLEKRPSVEDDEFNSIVEAIKKAGYSKIDNKEESVKLAFVKVKMLCNKTTDIKKGLYIDAKKVGKYIYNNRLFLQPDDIALFMGFWKTMDILNEKLKEIIEPQSRNQEVKKKKVSEDDFKKGISDVVNGIPNEIFGIGYNNQRMNNFYTKLLWEEESNSKMKENREFLLEKFTTVQENSTVNVGELPFVLIFARLENKDWFGELNLKDFDSMCNLVLGSYGEADKNRRRKYRTDGLNKERWPENVYDFIDNIIDRTFE